MMKLSTKYGDMFSCGWLPPVGNIQAGFMAVLAVGKNGLVATVAHKLLAGVPRLALLELPTGIWLCAGISDIFRVCVVSPPSSPKAIPLPTWTGVRPCRFGKPKVTLPSPP